MGPASRFIQARSVSDGISGRVPPGRQKSPSRGLSPWGVIDNAGPDRAKFQRSSSFSRSRLPPLVAPAVPPRGGKFSTCPSVDDAMSSTADHLSALSTYKPGASAMGPASRFIQARSVSDGISGRVPPGRQKSPSRGISPVGRRDDASPDRAKFQRSSSFSRSRLPTLVLSTRDQSQRSGLAAAAHTRGDRGKLFAMASRNSSRLVTRETLPRKSRAPGRPCA